MKSNTLLEHYKTLLPWNLARTKCFVGMILGMISSGSVQQHKTAIGFSGYATQVSGCARIRDFLKNFTFNFSNYAKAMVAISQLNSPFDLVIDRTNWKFGRTDINLLVLAMVIKNKFAIPLFWKTLPKQGSSNADERIDLMGKFINAFGIEQIGSLMEDREFIGKVWMDFLIRQNIPFFIRTGFVV